MASLTYLDPRDDVIKTLDALRSARLVISEAMHGAIVADVLRVPWIPLQISPLTSAFKWVDWASSLSVPYEPRMLEPASVWEMQRYRRLSRQQRAMDLPLPNMVGNQQRLVSEFRRRYTRPDGLSKGPSAFEQWRRRGRSVAARMLALGQRGGDGPYLDAAAKRLQQLAREAGYLSEDRIFGTRLDQMREAVRVLEQRVR